MTWPEAATKIVSDLSFIGILIAFMFVLYKIFKETFE